MISITLDQIVKSVDILKTLSKQDLNARLAYKICKIILAVDEEYNAFQDTRMKVITKYGEKNEDGTIKNDNGQVMILPENVEDAQRELKELLETQVNLNVNALTIDELENCTISPADMINLMPFIEE